MKSNGCVKVLFAAILPLPFVTCHQKEKENASMACLLSPSKRPFQDTVHVRIWDSWTKPVSLIISYLLISVVNSYGYVLLWVIQFWFCEQTQKHTPKYTACFTSMLTRQYQAAVGHDQWCVVTVTLHGCHGGHHRYCESIHCCTMSSVSAQCVRMVPETLWVHRVHMKSV